MLDWLIIVIKPLSLMNFQIMKDDISCLEVKILNLSSYKKMNME